METEIREGVGKQAYRDYTQALKKWLIPYFGGTDIAKLDLAAVTRFDAWRTAQNGKVPAQSTINNHNSALNRVLVLFTSRLPVGSVRRAYQLSLPARLSSLSFL